MNLAGPYSPNAEDLPDESRNGNFWAVVNVKSWVKELTWLQLSLEDYLLCFSQVQTRVTVTLLLICYLFYLFDYNSESFRLSLEDYLESEDEDLEEAKDESKDEVEEQVARCVSTN